MQVGDKVKMSDVGKKHYTNSKFNPFNLNGVVNNKSSSLNIKVEWSNGEKNSYEPKELELVEPKQEQYYTSIPTDVKIGDKFEIISETGYKDEFRWAGSKKFPLGSIVTLDYEIPSDEPRFVNSNGDGTYLNWGCLKPVKDTKYNVGEGLKQYPLTPDEMIKPKVGDLVLLKKGSNWNYAGEMDKYHNTVQQIANINKDDFNIAADPKWFFEFSNIVKIVEEDQQFNIGDEVELVEAIKELNVGMRGTIKSVPNDGRGFIDVMINGSLHNIFNRRLKLITGKSNQFSIGDSVYVTQEYIDKRLTGCCPKEKLIINNKIEQNGEVHSNTTGNQSIALHGIPASIICGTIGRGKTISCSRAEIKLGN